MPSSLPVTAETVNYASAVFVGFVVVASAWYWIWGYKNYAGPPTHEDALLEHRLSVSVAERQSIRAGYRT